MGSSGNHQEPGSWAERDSVALCARALADVCSLPEGLEGLRDLAFDLRWTWSHAGDRLWQSIDGDLWKATLNPWLILQEASDEKLERLAADTSFRSGLARVVSERSEYLQRSAWYQQTHREEPLGGAAYLSMEFGLGSALPLYAGGLGVLAGDFLKSASDLGVPVAGVGLFFQEGYFRQLLDPDGRQIEVYPHDDPDDLPLVAVRDRADTLLRLKLDLPGRALVLRVWRAQIGRVPLYLLDSNVPSNAPADRGITCKLYEAEPERRLLQEMVLGIGGWRLVEALRLNVEVCHLNEGHAAFAVLERALSFMKKTGRAFEEALWSTRAGNVFTSHTPVAAGFDRFAPELIVRYFRDYAEELQISLNDFLALGRASRQDEGESFNMAFLAARGCGSVNAVSRLHGEVSKEIFQPLFPRWPRVEVPIRYVTNGVHIPSWSSQRAMELWTHCCGEDHWLTTEEDLCEALCAASDEHLWSLRSENRQALVAFARERLVLQRGQRGADPEEIERARYVLDPDALTLGFARRFTVYKRPDLVLHDPLALERILAGGERRVQLVVAGKAHPQDEEGKRLIRRLVNFAERPEVRNRMVFLEDYDISLAQHLVQGVDVWLNTPRRPWEACGTSGMKVLANGGLNLSELDGWWAEGYAPDLGWALGDGREHGDDPGWDASEARQLYDLLEREVIPEFYDRDAAGLPRRWLDRIRRSLGQLAPQFGGNRMVRRYVDDVYLSAAASVKSRSDVGGTLGTELNAWQTALSREWDRIRLNNFSVEECEGKQRFRLEVYLGGLHPDFVAVELYADPVGEAKSRRVPMTRATKSAGAEGEYSYEAIVDHCRPSGHFTPRVIAHHPHARIPLEDVHIRWLR